MEVKHGKYEFPYENLSSNIRLYRQEERLVERWQGRELEGGKKVNAVSQCVVQLMIMSRQITKIPMISTSAS